MSKKAVIYARVSTDDQAERGYSLPSQIEACQKFAVQKGFEVAAVYQDDISGAKSITSRPEGGQLQLAIDSRQVSAVIIYQVDRLSRDIVDLLTTVRDWLQLGVEIYTLDVGQVMSELDIVLVIKGWQGSDERKKIIERTSRGRYGKAKAGKAVGAGTPPYGYLYENGELTIKEPEAGVVQMIFSWYVEGDKQGNTMSIVGIAKRLSKMGIPTPSESKGWKRKRQRPAGVWDGSSVHWILLSETYCGVLRYGKYIGKSGRGGKRPESEHVIVEVPTIVTREMWEVAQERRAFNSRVAKRRTKRNYLLRSFIKCGCGRSMSGGKGRYICGGKYDYTLIKPCIEQIYKSEIIDSLVWDYVMGLITSEHEFEDKLREAQEREADSLKPTENELQNVIELIERTEQEADQIARAFRKVKGIVAARIEKQSEEVDNRYEALLTRKNELEKSITRRYLTNDNISNLLEFREIVAVGLQNPTFEDKRRWLEVLRIEIKIKNKIAVIACRLPIDPLTIDLGASKSDNGNDGGPGSSEGGSAYEFRTSRSLKIRLQRKLPRLALTSEPIDLTELLNV